MLFKMLGIEEAYKRQQAEHETNLPRPRQVFITLSGVLAKTVEVDYSKLASSAAAARGADTHGLPAEQANAERGLVGEVRARTGSVRLLSDAIQHNVHSAHGCLQCSRATNGGSRERAHTLTT